MLNQQEISKLNDLVELNQRESDGTAVALLWDSSTGQTYIEVETEDFWHREEIKPEQATEAFNHPYCYLPLKVAPAVKVPA